MINWPTAAAGAVIGAVAADAYDNAKDKAQGAAGQSTIEHGPVEMGMLVEMVSNIEKAIHEAKAAQCPPDMRVQNLPNDTTTQAGYILKRRGYKHVSVLVAANITVAVRTMIGLINFNLTTGWNAFDMPSDSEVWLHGATDTKVIFYWGDDALDIPGV